MNGDINIKKAVLHILDSSIEVPILSSTELELDSCNRDLIEKYVSKAFEDSNIKAASFKGENNKVRYLCQLLNDNNDDFLDISLDIASTLFEIMVKNVDIAPADLICSLFSINGCDYLGIFKLNYKTGFTHYVQHTEEGNTNTIITHRTILPSEGQKIDECSIINLQTLDIKLLEKQYEVNGEREFYLSAMFLNCSTDLSSNAKIKILDKVTKQINQKYFDEGFDKVAMIKKAVSQSLEESNIIKVDSIVEEVFSKTPDIQKEYLEEVSKAGLRDEIIAIPENLAEKKFKTHKIKTDTGIEINFPLNFYNDQDKIEFVNNPDGTISILIKNVGKIINK